MNMAYLMIPVALLAVSLLISFILVKKGKPAKKVMRVHFLTLILIVAATCAVPFMASAAANDPAAAEEVATAVTSVGDGMKYLAAALAVGLAGIGGGIAPLPPAPPPPSAPRRRIPRLSVNPSSSSPWAKASACTAC